MCVRPCSASGARDGALYSCSASKGRDVRVWRGRRGKGGFDSGCQHRREAHADHVDERVRDADMRHQQKQRDNGELEVVCATPTCSGGARAQLTGAGAQAHICRCARRMPLC